MYYSGFGMWKLKTKWEHPNSNLLISDYILVKYVPKIALYYKINYSNTKNENDQILNELKSNITDRLILLIPSQLGRIFSLLDSWFFCRAGGFLDLNITNSKQSQTQIRTTWFRYSFIRWLSFSLPSILKIS